MAKDYYELLEVDKNATKEQIKKQYKKLANKHHPDKNGGDETTFKEIKNAYETLYDDDKRAIYDQYGPDGAPASGFGGGFNPFDIFGFGGGHQQTIQQVLVTLTLEEAAAGCTKPISYTKSHKCGTCNGSGAKSPDKMKNCPHCGGKGHTSHPHFPGMAVVCNHCGGKGKIITEACTTCKGSGQVNKQEHTNIKIPAGVPHGAQMRGGDVIILIHVMDHSTYIRQGNDLYREVLIDAIEAMLGTTREITTLNKEKLKLTIPAGTQYGTKLKMSNKGITFEGQTGHIFCVIKINIPTSLTDKQKGMLEKFNEREN